MSTFYSIHLKWGPDIVSLQMWSADESELMKKQKF